MKLIVGDASSLILLAKANVLDDLLELTDIIIPTIVYDEIMKGKEKNKQDAYIIEKFLNQNKIRIINPMQENVTKIKTICNLDMGELFAITLARETNLGILIDDKKGMLVCNQIGIKIHTALLILNELAVNKHISKNQIEFAFEILIREGRYKEKEINFILNNIKERGIL